MIVRPTRMKKILKYGTAWCGRGTETPCGSSGSPVGVRWGIGFISVSMISIQNQQSKIQNDSNQIQQREQEDPDQIDEVPVQPDVFGLIRENLPAQRLREQEEDRNNPADHVKSVHAGQREIAGVKDVLPRAVGDVLGNRAALDREVLLFGLWVGMLRHRFDVVLADQVNVEGFSCCEG